MKGFAIIRPGLPVADERELLPDGSILRSCGGEVGRSHDLGEILEPGQNPDPFPILHVSYHTPVARQDKYILTTAAEAAANKKVNVLPRNEDAGSSPGRCSWRSRDALPPWRKLPSAMSRVVPLGMTDRSLRKWTPHGKAPVRYSS
jgi:hypothetical protein